MLGWFFVHDIKSSKGVNDWKSRGRLVGEKILPKEHRTTENCQDRYSNPEELPYGGR